MKRGRKPRADPPVRWELSIPLSLATEVEIALIDPVRQRTAHGARSELVIQLLRRWLAQQEERNDLTTRG